MKKVFYQDKYYQIAVIAYSQELCRSEYKRIHVLADGYEIAVQRAKVVNEFDYHSFNMFLLQYRFIKDVLAKEYVQLKKIEILRFYFESCLRVWSMNDRIVDTEVLIRRTANRVIGQYVRNRNEQ